MSWKISLFTLFYIFEFYLVNAETQVLWLCIEIKTIVSTFTISDSTDKNLAIPNIVQIVITGPYSAVPVYMSLGAGLMYLIMMWVTVLSLLKLGKGKGLKCFFFFFIK